MGGRHRRAEFRMPFLILYYSLFEYTHRVKPRETLETGKRVATWKKILTAFCWNRLADKIFPLPAIQFVHIIHFSSSLDEEKAREGSYQCQG